MNDKILPINIREINININYIAAGAGYPQTNKKERIGGESEWPRNLVPAAAVRLLKRRVLSRPGVNSP